MAERLSPAAAGRIAAALDSGAVTLERDGLTARLPARVGVVAEDEGLEEEAPPAVLCERLGFCLDLSGLALRDLVALPLEPETVAAARALLPRVQAEEAVLRALCAGAAALGIASLRAPLQALHAARAAAALDGRRQVGEDDVALAAALVLAPRATRLPPPPDAGEADTPAETDPDAEDAAPPQAPPPEEARERAPPPPRSADPEPAETQPDEREPGADGPELSERVLEAAAAAIPRGLLDRLKLAGQGSRGAQAGGTAGLAKPSLKRGRPIGARPGRPAPGLRLDLVETLRAAAPWQRLRRTGEDEDQEGNESAGPADGGRRRLAIRAEDFRVTRFKQRSGTATLFLVDASGSAAFHRLAEAKGAVELLLADCYVRRDQVALLAFRGTEAELLLPPTRSLVRAKRALAALPGGGGTPLAAGLEAAGRLARALRRRGVTPLLVVLTDGQANIARDGQPGRAQARADAEAAARLLAREGQAGLLVDTAPRPSERARSLAGLMAADYLALPQADARKLNQAVRARRTG